MEDPAENFKGADNLKFKKFLIIFILIISIIFVISCNKGKLPANKDDNSDGEKTDFSIKNKDKTKNVIVREDEDDLVKICKVRMKYL